MSRTTAAALLLVFVLAGCDENSGEGSLEPPPDTDVAAPSSEEPGFEPQDPGTPPDDGLPDAADGTDFGACAQGNCEVLVSESSEIPVDPSFGVDTITIAEVDSDAITVQATGAGSYLQVVVGTDGTGSLNGIVIEVVSIAGGQAVLSMST